MSEMERTTVHDLLLEPSPDFRVKPAGGELLDDGDVLVSGFKIPQKEIDSVGHAYGELTGILASIND